MSDNKDQFSGNLPFAFFNSAMEYMVDAGQRTLLFWDVMHQRGRQYQEHLEQAVPNVLSYQPELIMDGRTLGRPVNYGLVRIVPPEGVEVDPPAGRSSSSIPPPVRVRRSVAPRLTARLASR